VEPLNIWEVQVAIDKRAGEIYRVGADGQDISLKVEGQHVFRTQMANYFSVGQCAKVGYDFERNRTGSKCCN